MMSWYLTWPTTAAWQPILWVWPLPCWRFWSEVRCGETCSNNPLTYHFSPASSFCFIPPHPLSPSTLPGAPISNLTAVVLNSTAISLSWSHPPPHLTNTLSSYLVQYGVSDSQHRETLQLDKSLTFVLLSELEEASEYQFGVSGHYGDVPGVVVTVTATTDEDGG